jgi:hypothetical protein
MQDPDITLYQLNFYKPLIDKANRITEEYVGDKKPNKKVINILSTVIHSFIYN